MRQENRWEEDYRTFFERFVKPILRGVATKYGPQVLNDVGDDLFRSLWQDLKNGKYDERRPFGNWLNRKIQNGALNLLRKRKARREVSSDALAERAAGQPGPLRLLVSREEQDRARKVALEALERRPALRRVVILKLIEGIRDLEGLEEEAIGRRLAGWAELDREELAARLGLSRAYVDQIVSRFVRECQGRMGRHE
jgi:RNA polymerase sigma factor (sigma-70 family)